MDVTTTVLKRLSTPGSESREQKAPCLYLSMWAAVTGVLVCLVIGAGYLVAEAALAHHLHDVPFVLMLVAATAYLFVAMTAVSNFVLKNAPESFNYLNSVSSQHFGPDTLEQLKGDVYAPGRMTVAGVVYGASIGLAPVILAVWPNHPELRLLLVLFLFVVNFVTGVAFYGILAIGFHMWRIWPSVTIDLWGKENPGTYFIFGLTRRVAILGGLYSSVCMSSILFSVLPLQGYVIAYSVFAALVNLTCVAVPGVLTALRVSAERRRALYLVNARIEREFSEVLRCCEAVNDPIELRKLDDLLGLRNRVHEVHTLPFSAKMVSVALSVVAMAWLPPILQVILQHIWK